jgi:polyhydroxybutyrate depolymerase
LALAACTAHVAGLQDCRFRIDGDGRSYQLYVPASAGAHPPLVVALHRFTEDGAIMAKLTGFNELADREGFVVVYPDGPGYRFEAFDNDERDDVAFVRAVLDEVAKRVDYDRTRVYVTGASNGGFLTHRLACLAPELFAAAAPVMALLPRRLADRVPDGAPVPMLMIHGTKDGIVKEEATSVFAGARYDVLPMSSTVAYWVHRNGSQGTAIRTELPDADPDDGTRVTLHRYPAQKGGVETRFYRVDGGGHTWPGGNERAPRFIVGKTSRDFSATEAIWAFFSSTAPRPPRSRP